MSNEDWMMGFLLYFSLKGWLDLYVAHLESKHKGLPFPPDRIPEISSLIAAKENIKALRKVREITGWNLRRAKEFVMDLEKCTSKPSS